MIDLLPAITPGAAYPRHGLHMEGRVWVEKNCYVDVWIELVHALGLEPLAMMPFTLTVDFEDDQWTFFKPPHGELRELYGIDVQELNVWRPLLDHAIEHLRAGKLISTEADSFWLPDTAGTDYRQAHGKTTIVLSAIDVDGRRARYFHNAGYFELHGEDFDGLFGLPPGGTPPALPLFAEFVRIDRARRLPDDTLRRQSLALLRRHLAWRPATSPIHRFAARFARDLPALQSAGLAQFHAWAFGSLRQAGAAFELAAANLRWLADGHPAPASWIEATDAFYEIARLNQSMILKCARAVNSGRAFDPTPIFEPMARAWERGMHALDAEATSSLRSQSD